MLHWLELKLPPPLVALLCGLAIWQLDRGFPQAALLSALGFASAAVSDADPGQWLRRLAAMVALLGMACDLSALLAFRRHRTTVNPMRPQASVAVVSTGVYRLTRNPMYLGLALLLTALSLYLDTLWGAVGVPVFAAWVTRLQIVPEERILLARFGEPYRQYCQRVRRWI